MTEETQEDHIDHIGDSTGQPVPKARPKQTCDESYSIIPFDTSLTCCIALCTVVQYCVCPQSSSLSTDHMRKHIDITHASAWLKVTLKRDTCCTRVRSTLLNVCQNIDTDDFFFQRQRCHIICVIGLTLNQVRTTRVVSKCQKMIRLLRHDPSVLQVARLAKVTGRRLCKTFSLATPCHCHLPACF